MSRVPRALIIGAGFSGMGFAAKLLQAGYSVTLLERAERVGGTWRENTYPGCACDIPAHLYSYSFELNHDWSHTFAGYAEIHAYLERCVDRLGLRDCLRLGVEVADARFDEDNSLWRVVSTDGEEFEAEVLISATGPLSRPKTPEIPGLESFGGPQFHTARWDHSVDLAGKRVGVIGTGASSIQVVPGIAETTGSLHVFQRTPPWIVPRQSGAYSSWLRSAFHLVPGLTRAYRSYLYWRQESLAPGFTKDPAYLKPVARFAKKHMEKSIEDPALRALLTPQYQLGCKRMLVSDDYYPALARPNVFLETDSIVGVEPGGVRMAGGGLVELDVLVLATGFDVSDFTSPITLTGTQGRTLGEIWAEGAEAYYGLAVRGLPNFMLLIGPNTGLGHNSILFMAECQYTLGMQLMDKLRRGARQFEVTAEAQERFLAEVQVRLAGTVWATGCSSWYRRDDGRIETLWPGSTTEFWWRTRRLIAGDFEFG